ncbi:cell division protein SepF [Microaerobacter geothermalis]|uniref:cell division protein SepF n=1 Tax=Microaerobacter geothermalis TaxID=674972 RepID=UPI001F1C16FF|nr:cell division protein SepF [Microaerobacter geothermalis]MCF6094740.1 cell division protein SepF [Microaerobacter geothermalis]
MGMMHRIMGFFGLAEEQVVEREELLEEEVVSFPKKGKNNVIPLQQVKSNLRVILCEPRTYEEAQEMADHLKQKRPIIVNLQRLPKEQARRFIDFLSGTVYALNGNIQKVGLHIFLCAPEHVDVQGSITQLENETN